MHVVADGSQIAAGASDDQGFVATREHMAVQLMTAIEPCGVGAEKPFHAGHEVGLRRLDHEMKMIRHQAECVDLPAGLGAYVRQRLEKRLAIQIVSENILAPIPATHRVIDCAGELNA